MSLAAESAGRLPARRELRCSLYRNLSIVYEGSSEVIHLRTPDISAHGMFISTARRFPEGSVLKLAFRLARSGVEIETRAEVRYCLTGVGIGVEFVDISAECQRAIESELELTCRP